MLIGVYGRVAPGGTYHIVASPWGSHRATCTTTLRLRDDLVAIAGVKLNGGRVCRRCIRAVMHDVELTLAEIARMEELNT